MMKVLYVSRSFLDYRTPMLKRLNDELKGDLLIWASKAGVSEWTRNELEGRLSLKHEFVLGSRDNITSKFANSQIRIALVKVSFREIYNSDVVIFDGFFQWTFPSVFIAAMLKKKIIVCYERTKYTERNAGWFRLVYRKFVSRFVDGFALNGSETINYLRDAGMLEEKPYIQGQMVCDTQRFSEANSSSETNGSVQQSEDVRLIFVGQLIERKGIVHLVKQLALMSKNFTKNVHLDIYGDGELKGELGALLHEAKAKFSFSLKGIVDNRTLPDIYKKYHAMVLPTLEDNWALVLPEALAADLPVICSIYNGGAVDLIVEGANGYTYDPLLPSEGANQLFHAIENIADIDRSILRRKNVEILEFHNPESAARRFKDLIEAII